MKNTNIIFTGVKSETNFIKYLFVSGFLYIIYYGISSVIVAFILSYNNFQGNEFEEKFYCALLATFILLIHIYREVSILIKTKNKK